MAIPLKGWLFRMDLLLNQKVVLCQGVLDLVLAGQNHLLGDTPSHIYTDQLR